MLLKSIECVNYRVDNISLFSYLPRLDILFT